MTEISAGLVKELREITGLGMMECKKALSEVGGDLRKAEELLRIKSGAKASKAAGRVAAEGVIGTYLSPDARLGALVEVNCETDFVAKNEDFLAFARALAELVATAAPADVPALSALAIDGAAVEDRRQKLVQKIGENISIRRDILSARAKESGKPPEIVAKMVEGGLNKFLGEISLLGQPFVKDDKQTIEKMLARRKAKVIGYRFLVVGEGIQRKAADFAAEVMAQAGIAR
jgi:translation elongation factor EF-Ts